MLALVLLYVFSVWIFSWCDLFQVTETDASCVQVTLYSAYCTCFVALLASPYADLLRTCSYFFLVQFNSSVYIRTQFELHRPLQS